MSREDYSKTLNSVSLRIEKNNILYRILKNFGPHFLKIASQIENCVICWFEACDSKFLSVRVYITKYSISNLDVDRNDQEIYFTYQKVDGASRGSNLHSVSLVPSWPWSFAPHNQTSPFTVKNEAMEKNSLLKTYFLIRNIATDSSTLADTHKQ